ncbi:MULTISPECIES: ribosome maturation factor RimM [Candidatus Ichthyocystis]|uniref:ribosome maturation factor RimM n=1 Tax=Candidatus Ichthyocystis TaxID=2929841 RepID=UPI0015856D79|nr:MULTISPECIES: ribosome maturation factor RimM [Ichthyocystis]
MALRDSEWVPLGRVARPFSINGWFWLFDYGEVAVHLVPGLSCCLRKSSDSLHSSVVSWFSCSSRLRLLISGIRDRSTADFWVGADFMVRRCDFPEVLDGEYYWVDLLHMKVENQQGHTLGTVNRIMRGVSDDFLDVCPLSGTGSFLIPARSPFFFGLDAERSVVLVDWFIDGR